MLLLCINHTTMPLRLILHFLLLCYYISGQVIASSHEVCHPNTDECCHFLGRCNTEGTGCNCYDEHHYWATDMCSTRHEGPELRDEEFCTPNTRNYYCSYNGVCNSNGTGCICDYPSNRFSHERCAVYHSSISSKTCVDNPVEYCSNAGECDKQTGRCTCWDPEHYWASEQCKYWHSGPALEPGQYCTPNVSNIYCSLMGVCSSDGMSCICQDAPHRLSSERCKIWHHSDTDPQCSFQTLAPALAPASRPTNIPTHSSTTRPTGIHHTDIPTGIQTASPSVMASFPPSTVQTASPTVSPSASPSVVASFPPSTVQTASPTVSPSPSPLVVSSFPPSTVQTASPTVSPSASPTVSPSASPSVVSSFPPSTVQTASPTVSPSPSPSVVSSFPPSTVLTASPTASPSPSPLVMASIPPSTVQTASPSVSPSASPTVVSSFPPSTVQTASPTAYPSFHPSGLTDLVFPSIFLEKSTTAMQFNAICYNDDEYRVQSERWLRFVDNVLANPFDLRFNAITFRGEAYDEYANSLLQYTAECNDSAIVNELVSAVIEGASISRDCSGVSWSTVGKALCINCAEPNASASCVDYTANMFTSTPDQLWRICDASRLMPVGIAIDLMFRDVPAPNVPTLHSVEIVRTTDTTIMLAVNTSVTFLGGIVHAGAFPTGFSPGDVHEISNQGYRTWSPAMDQTEESSVIVFVEISGLYPATAYDAYLTSEDSLGSFSGIAEMHFVPAVVTLCCLKVETENSPSYVFASSDSYAQLSPEELATFSFVFSLRRPPISDVSLRPLFRLADGSAIIENVTLSSPFVKFRAGADFFGRASFVVVSAPVGIYSLSFTVEGDSDLDLEVPRDMQIDVISADTIPVKTPRLVSATFAETGAYLQLEFDSATDMAFTALSEKDGRYWECDKLFHFVGVEDSQCEWSSRNSVNAFFGNADGVAHPVPGDDIALLENRLRQFCVTENCSSYPYATDSVTTARAPVTCVNPDIVLLAPTQVGRCEDFVVDPSLSSGTAGRQWSTLHWRVSVDDDSDPSALRNYLNTIGHTSSPLTIPYSLLRQNTSYVLSLGALNFLQPVDTAMVYRSVIFRVVDTPSLSVILVTPRLLHTPQSSSVDISTSVIATVSCENPQRNKPSRRYSFKVYRNFVYQADLTSISSNPSRLWLESLSTASGVTYQLTSQVSAGGTVASGRVDVHIVPGEVTSAILGGSERVVGAASGLVLNGTSSSGAHEFAWNCRYRTAIRYDEDCNFLLPSDSRMRIVRVEGGAMSAGEVYEFFLTARRSHGPSPASSTASVVVIVSDAAPLLPTPSVVIAEITASKIVLEGTVTADNSSLTAAWALGEGIAEHLLSPLQRTISANTSVVFPLALSAISPGGGAKLTFSLYVDSPSAGLYAHAKITLVTNRPPTGGLFVVHPQSGFALTTVFNFVAQFWSDYEQDYPLRHQFMYSRSPQEMDLLLASFGVLPHTSNGLLAGLQSNNYSLTCILCVSDSQRAEVCVRRDVWVLEADSPVQSGVSGNLTAFLTDLDSDGVVKLVQTTALQLQAKNCSSAPDCLLLHRISCYEWADTCGPCEMGYEGPSGPSNLPCSQLGTLNDVGDTCESDSSCVLGNCVNHTCVAPVKRCPIAGTAAGVCSSHGRCVFFSSLGDSVDSCLDKDPFCTAQCVCDVGYGGTDCSKSFEEVATAEFLRLSLCESLLNVTEFEDESSEFLALISNTVQTVYNPAELTGDSSLVTCGELVMPISSMISSGFLLSTNEDLLQSILDSISTLLATSVVVSPQHATAAAVRIRSDEANRVRSNVASLSEIVIRELHKDMSPGQRAVEATSDAIRVSVMHESRHSFKGKVLQAPNSQPENKRFSALPSLTLPASGFSSCGEFGEYAKVAVILWTSPPAAGSENVGFIFQVGTLSTGSSYREDSVDDRYSMLLTFATKQVYNNTEPGCVQYGDDGVTPQPCRCNITEFSPYNSSYVCANVQDVCPPAILINPTVGLNYDSNRRQLQSDGAKEYTTLRYGVSVFFVGQPETLRREVVVEVVPDAKIGISMAVVVLMLMLIGFLMLRRWDIADARVLQYHNKMDADPSKFNLSAVFDNRGIGSIDFHATPFVEDTRLNGRASAKSFLRRRNEFDIESSILSSTAHHVHSSAGCPVRTLDDGAVQTRNACSDDTSRVSADDSEITLDTALQGLGPTASTLDEKYLHAGEIIVRKLHKTDQKMRLNDPRPQLLAKSADPRPTQVSDFGHRVVAFDERAVEADEARLRSFTTRMGLPPHVPNVSMLANRSQWQQFKSAIMRHHRIVRIFSYPSVFMPRQIRFLSACNDILVLLFVDTVFFGAFYPDDNTCESFSGKSSESCLSTQSHFERELPMCQWNEDSRRCSLRVPDASLQFVVSVSITLIILSIIPKTILRFVIETYCRCSWNYFASEEVSASSEGGEARLPAANACSRQMLESPALIGSSNRLADVYRKGLKETDNIISATIAFTTKFSQMYHRYDSVTAEAEADQALAMIKWYLMYSLNRLPPPWKEMGMSVQRISSIEAIFNDFGFHIDGSPRTLSLWDRICFGSQNARLAHKIQLARVKSRKLGEKCLHYRQASFQNACLLQSFVLEMLPRCKRFAVQLEMGSYDQASPHTIAYTTGINAWLFVVVCWGFMVCWSLVWSTTNGANMQGAWARVFILVFTVDCFVNEMVQIHVLYVQCLCRIKPQLEQCYHVLNQLLVDKHEPNLTTMSARCVNVVHHLSPACRTARLCELGHLIGAELLMQVDDNAVALCQQQSASSLGAVPRMILFLPTYIGMGIKCVEIALIDMFLPTSFFIFLVANFYIIKLSPYILASLYVVLVLYLSVRHALLPHLLLTRRTPSKFSGEEKSLSRGWRAWSPRSARFTEHMSTLELLKELLCARVSRKAGMTTRWKNQNLADFNQGRVVHCGELETGMSPPESVHSFSTHALRRIDERVSKNVSDATGHFRSGNSFGDGSPSRRTGEEGSFLREAELSELSNGPKRRSSSPHTAADATTLSGRKVSHTEMLMMGESQDLSNASLHSDSTKLFSRPTRSQLNLSYSSMPSPTPAVDWSLAGLSSEKSASSKVSKPNSIALSSVAHSNLFDCLDHRGRGRQFPSLPPPQSQSQFSVSIQLSKRKDMHRSQPSISVFRSEPVLRRHLSFVTSDVNVMVTRAARMFSLLGDNGSDEVENCEDSGVETSQLAVLVNWLLSTFQPFGHSLSQDDLDGVVDDFLHYAELHKDTFTNDKMDCDQFCFWLRETLSVIRERDVAALAEEYELVADLESVELSSGNSFAADSAASVQQDCSCEQANEGSSREAASESASSCSKPFGSNGKLRRHADVWSSWVDTFRSWGSLQLTASSCDEATDVSLGSNGYYFKQEQGEMDIVTSRIAQGPISRAVGSMLSGTPPHISSAQPDALTATDLMEFHSPNLHPADDDDHNKVVQSDELSQPVDSRACRTARFSTRALDYANLHKLSTFPTDDPVSTSLQEYLARLSGRSRRRFSDDDRDKIARSRDSSRGERHILRKKRSDVRLEKALSALDIAPLAHRVGNIAESLSRSKCARESKDSYWNDQFVPAGEFVGHSMFISRSNSSDQRISGAKTLSTESAGKLSTASFAISSFSATVGQAVDAEVAAMGAPAGSAEEERSGVPTSKSAAVTFTPVLANRHKLSLSVVSSGLEDSDGDEGKKSMAFTPEESSKVRLTMPGMDPREASPVEKEDTNAHVQNSPLEKSFPLGVSNTKDFSRTVATDNTQDTLLVAGTRTEIVYSTVDAIEDESEKRGHNQLERTNSAFSATSGASSMLLGIAMHDFDEGESLSSFKSDSSCSVRTVRNGDGDLPFYK